MAQRAELRERGAGACQQSGRSAFAQFSASDSLVRSLRGHQRTSGSLAALPPRSGPAPLLNAAAQAQLAACLRQEPDATLAEPCIWLAALGGPAVRQATRWRAVRALEWRQNKERPRRRARHRPREDPAGGLSRSLARRRCCLF